MRIVFLAVLFVTILIGCVLSTPEETCNAQSNTTCKTCLHIDGCAFCKKTKECFPRPTIPVHDGCSTSDLQITTCFANTQTLLIVFGSIGGVLLLAILVIVCCCCRRCKQRAMLTENKRQNLNERQLEDRRAAAQIRSTERNEKADQIRLKYGIMQGKDTSVEYRRMT